jgi:hypothetical protein
MKIVSFVEQEYVIEQISRHCGLLALPKRLGEGGWKKAAPRSPPTPEPCLSEKQKRRRSSILFSPIRRIQLGNSGEFPDIGGYQAAIMGQNRGSDYKVIRPDNRAFYFEPGTYAGINFRRFRAEGNYFKGLQKFGYKFQHILLAGAFFSAEQQFPLNH